MPLLRFQSFSWFFPFLFLLLKTHPKDSAFSSKLIHSCQGASPAVLDFSSIGPSSHVEVLSPATLSLVSPELATRKKTTPASPSVIRLRRFVSPGLHLPSFFAAIAIYIQQALCRVPTHRPDEFNRPEEIRRRLLRHTRWRTTTRPHRHRRQERDVLQRRGQSVSARRAPVRGLELAPLRDKSKA